MKKIILIVVLILITSITFAKDFPIDKKEYLFKLEDPSNIGMGYCKILFEGKNNIETNPALAAGGKGSSYIGLVYNLQDLPRNLSDDVLGEIDKNEFTYIYFTSPMGGLAYRRIHEEDTILKDEEKNINDSKYDLTLNEIILSVTQKSETTEGLRTGLNIKLYFGQMLEASLSEEGNANLNIGRGYGVGADLALNYKKDIFSFSAVWEDIYTKIFWSEYKDLLINSSVNLGAGLDFNLLKCGITANKVFVADSNIIYGAGMELIMFDIPEEYSYFSFKGVEGKFYYGISGSNIFKSKKKYNYGFEIENDKMFMNIGCESENSDPFVNKDTSIYKISIGGAISSFISK